MTTIPRKYDIGHGVILDVTKHQIIARWENSSRSIIRPAPIPGEEVNVIYSLDGLLYYLPEYTFTHGRWMSVKEWATREEMNKSLQEGIWGKEYVQFHPPGQELYYREAYSFSTWKVKHQPAAKKIKTDTNMALDAISLYQQEQRQHEKEFNEEIAFTGRDLKWVLEKIGLWVEPTEIPIVVLGD